MQRAHEVVHRQPGVDDLVDEQDVTVLDLVAEILEEPDAVAVSGLLSVAREGADEVERMVDRHRAGQVADERDRRLQRPDEDRLQALVIACASAPSSPTRAASSPAREKYLPDAGIVETRFAQDAFCRPNRAADADSLPDYMQPIAGHPTSTPADNATKNVLALNSSMFELYDSAAKVFQRIFSTTTRSSSVCFPEPVAVSIFTSPVSRRSTRRRCRWSISS